MADAIRLVVLGDSFAYHDDVGPRLPGHPGLYPTVAAQHLAALVRRPVEATVVALPGWGVRDLWRALTKDQHLQFEVLARADAVIVAVGSSDHVPAGYPAVVDDLVGYLRPARIRRRVRTALRAAHPRLVAATRGALARTPTGVFADAFDRALFQIRGLTHGAPGVVLGPSGHRAGFYDGRNPHLAGRERLQRAIAARHGFATVAARPVVACHLQRLNADGIHWPVEVHAAIGRALADELAAQLQGRRPTPPNPLVGMTVGDRGATEGRAAASMGVTGQQEETWSS